MSTAEATVPTTQADPAEGERLCTIGRVLRVVGDKWTLRILCEAALNGVTRFGEFQDLLGIATDVLTQRLTKLVDEGLLAKSAYKEPGRRSRFAYELTDAGRDLRLVLGALQQWGDVHRPGRSGLTEVGRTREGGAPVRVALVDSGDAVVTAEDVDFRYAI